MRWMLLALLPACAWVSADDVAKALAGVDDDGDGAPASTDCDDGDPARFPGQVDDPYDGVDGDCAGDGDYDADGDGFAPDAYAGLPTEGAPEAPSLPGGDCDDTDPAMRPGATDDWYDGVDADCGGEDDYDQDGDGSVPDAYAGLPTAGVAGSGALPAGDCDDLAAGVSPTAADAWYDGVDSDCGGEDDYDQDGDGWVRDGDAGLATTYVAGSGALPEGDCDDALAAVYPEAPDAWYDGLDADCAGDDDFDQDGDGLGADLYGGTDCDDEAAEVYPGQTETLGDDVDSDCDGSVDGFALGPVPSCRWVGPHDPAFVSAGSSVYLSVVASEVDCGTRFFDAAMALRFDATDPTAGVVEAEPWLATTTDPPSYSVDAGQAVLLDGETLYGLLGLRLSTGRAMALVRYGLNDGSRTTLTVQDAAHSAPYDDVALAQGPDGTLHLLGCDATDGALSYAAVSSVSSGAADRTLSTDGVWARSCVIGADAGRERVYASGTAGMSAWTYTVEGGATLFSPYDTLLTFAATDMDWDGAGTLHLADGADAWAVQVADETVAGISAPGGATDVVATSLSGRPVYAWVDPTGGVGVGYGPDLSRVTTLSLDPGFVAEHVAVVARGGYLILAVTGGDELAIGIAGAP